MNARSHVADSPTADRLPGGASFLPPDLTATNIFLIWLPRDPVQLILQRSATQILSSAPPDQTARPQTPFATGD